MRRTSPTPAARPPLCRALGLVALVAVACQGSPPPEATPSPEPTRRAEASPAASPGGPCALKAGTRLAIRGDYRASLTMAPQVLIAKALGGEQPVAEPGDKRHIKTRVGWRLDAQVDVATSGAAPAELVGTWRRVGKAEGPLPPLTAPVPIRVVLASDCHLVKVGISSTATGLTGQAVRQTLRLLDFRAPPAGGEVDATYGADGPKVRWRRTDARITGHTAVGKAIAGASVSAVVGIGPRPWLDRLRADELRGGTGSADGAKAQLDARGVAPDPSWQAPQAAGWRWRAPTTKGIGARWFNPDDRDLSRMSLDELRAYQADLERRGENSAVRNGAMTAWLEADARHVTTLLQALDARRFRTQEAYYTALSCIARSGQPEGIAALRRYLADPKAHPQFRAQAATSLVLELARPPDDIVERLDAVTQEPPGLPGHRLVQQLATALLGTVHGRHREHAPELAAKARAVLVRKLSKPGQAKPVAFAALMGLGNARDDTLYPVLQPYLSHPDEETRIKAWQGLRGMSDALLLRELKPLWGLAIQHRTSRLALVKVWMRKLRSADDAPQAVVDLALGELAMGQDKLRGDYDLMLIQILNRRYMATKDPAIEAVFVAKYRAAMRQQNIHYLRLLATVLGKRALAATPHQRPGRAPSKRPEKRSPKESAR